MIASANEKRKVNRESREVTKRIHLDNRIEYYSDHQVYITLKNHKKNS